MFTKMALIRLYIIANERPEADKMMQTVGEDTGKNSSLSKIKHFQEKGKH